MSETKYLVTGACGFTGSHLCDLLHERGLDFRATDMVGADRSYLPSGAEFIPSDLTDPESLRTVVKDVDVVLHTAAIFDWSASLELLEAVNVQGMENLCMAASEAGVRRLVSWSTSGVYGNQQFDKLPICEDYPKSPIEDYSVTKHKQDQIAHRFNEEGKLATTIVRPGVVYGPRAKYGAAQMFDIFAALPVVFYPANFKYRLGTVHARDMGGASIFVADKEEAAGEEYCVVDSSGITIPGFIKLIAKAMGKPTVPLFVPPEISREAGLIAASISEWIAKNVTKSRPLLEKGPLEIFPVDVYISNKKILDLGYEFEYPTPERGVEEVVEWMQEEGMMKTNPIKLIRKMAGRSVPG